MAPRRWSWLWLYLVAGAAVLALVFWLALRGGTEEATANAPLDAPLPAPAEARHLPPVPRTPAPREPAPYKEEIVTSDGIPIAPPRGDVLGAAHPHPITPQHERIYGENRLVGALEGAMEVKDVAGMRRLLAQYRREYPEDDQELQDGYGIIADCMEHPGAGPRAAAERWLDAHNGSTAKRYVLRYCIEPPP
jgi:hypothetical protein